MRYDIIAVWLLAFLFCIGCWAGLANVCFGAVNDCEIVQIYNAEKKLHTTIKCETEEGDVFYRINTTEKRVEVIDGN